MLYQALEEAYADVLHGLRALGLPAQIINTGGSVYLIHAQLTPTGYLLIGDFMLLPDRRHHEYWSVNYHDDTQRLTLYSKTGDDVPALLAWIKDFCTWNGFSTGTQPPTR